MTDPPDKAKKQGNGRTEKNESTGVKGIGKGGEFRNSFNINSSPGKVTLQKEGVNTKPRGSERKVLCRLGQPPDKQPRKRRGVGKRRVGGPPDEHTEPTARIDSRGGVKKKEGHSIRPQRRESLVAREQESKRGP